MKYFLTTAIDFVNSRPHLGTAYEKITADIIARYRRLAGYETHFLMGNDEHSQNVFKRAQEQGKDPLAYCDEMERVFRDVEVAVHFESSQLTFPDGTTKEARRNETNNPRLRLERLHPRSVVKAPVSTILVPRPQTAAVAGRPVAGPATAVPMRVGRAGRGHGASTDLGHGCGQRSRSTSSLRPSIRPIRSNGLPLGSGPVSSSTASDSS